MSAVACNETHVPNFASGCNAHTTMYSLYSTGSVNTSDMFVRHSYGGNLPHPCKPYFARYYFLQDLYKQNITCETKKSSSNASLGASLNTSLNTLSLCDGEKFSKNGDVDHVIDLANSSPRLKKCNKNIYGNMIVANSKWNRQMGWKGWSVVKKEKKELYRKIYNKAKRHIVDCDIGCAETNDLVAYIVVPIVGGMTVFVISCAVIAYVLIKQLKLYKNELVYQLFLD